MLSTLSDGNYDNLQKANIKTSLGKVLKTLNKHDEAKLYLNWSI